jgi:hypothetical protein
MTTFLRRTHEGSTHWLGDDGYPACWHDHRECAEEQVMRLESALRDAIDALIYAGAMPIVIDHIRGALTNIGNQE